MIQFFHVDKAFVGTDGYDSEHGFTGKNLMRSEVVQYMSDVAENMIVLTDSSKFTKRGTVRRFGLSQVAQVITDTSISEDLVKELENARVTVRLV